MKRFLILCFSFLTFFLLIYFSQFPSGIKTKILKINNHKLVVEVADTDKLRSQGFSGRKTLTKDHGMLFIFPTPGYYKFWMKDMNFPLDFIWINKNTVVDLAKNIPPPVREGNNLPTFTSKFPFDKVIEVNSGLIESFNITVGNDIK